MARSRWQPEALTHGELERWLIRCNVRTGVIHGWPKRIALSIQSKNIEEFEGTIPVKIHDVSHPVSRREPILDLKPV